MARPEKVAEVEAIAGHLAAAQSVVLADYHGITVEQMTESGPSAANRTSSAAS